MIALFDFEDSFTFNIFSELRSSPEFQNDEIYLYSWREITLEKLRTHDVVVFGPGPGHPRDYEKILSPLRSWLEERAREGDYWRRQVFMGVCLGHQLLWQSLGANIALANRPIHGATEDLKLPDWDIFPASFRESTVRVQRYNSLVVRSPCTGAESNGVLGKTSFSIKNIESAGEVVLSRFFSPSLAGLTTQFHPESVGTSCPKAFFRALSSLRVYNSHDGYSSRRPL